MRQRDYRRFDWRQQGVLRESVTNTPGGCYIAVPCHIRRDGFRSRPEPISTDAGQSPCQRNPNVAVLRAPQIACLDHAPNLAMVEAPYPVTRLGHR